jgi:ribosomal protein S18 acetylase RimI-like enzyme
MIVRSATLDDCPAIARVQVDSYRGAYASLMPAEYLEAFTYADQEQDWRDWIEGTDDILLVAENDQGIVVGYALAKKIIGEETNYDGEIMALHVDRSYHRRGLGRALMAEAARQLSEIGCRSLGLWVLEGNPATGFYERLGGHPNGEKFFEIEELRLRRRELGYRWDCMEALFS